jgi:hypothetical protein
VRDFEKLPAWLREGADEIEKAHLILWELDVPETSPDGTPLTLPARILLLGQMFTEHNTDSGRDK